MQEQINKLEKWLDKLPKDCVVCWTRKDVLKFKKISGIYCFLNLVNGKMYIGSSNNLSSRNYSHINKLNLNKHDNEYFQRSWNKYKKINFIFIILEFCKEKELIQKEQYWMDYYLVYNNIYGYNIEFRANRDILSEFTKEKMSSSQRGEKSKFAKYTWKIVNKIRKDYNEGKYSIKKLSEKYGGGESTIGYIINNDSWFDPNYHRTYFYSDNFLNEQDIEYIRKNHKNGNCTINELAEKFGKTQQHIRIVIYNKFSHDPDYIPNVRKNKKILTKEIVLLIKQTILQNEQKTIKEISKILNIPLDTVKHAIYKNPWKNIGKDIRGWAENKRILRNNNIAQDYKNGDRISDLVIKYKLTKTQIIKIINKNLGE